MPKKKLVTSKSQAIREYLAEHPSARPSEIVEALRMDGIEINLALPKSIPKPQPVKKSQVVREYLAEHPKTSPLAVVKALEERGVAVTSALVSNIMFLMAAERRKSEANAKRKPSRRPRPTKAKPPMSATRMKQVRKWVEANGGIEQARVLLDELSEALDYLENE